MTSRLVWIKSLRHTRRRELFLLLFSAKAKKIVETDPRYTRRFDARQHEFNSSLLFRFFLAIFSASPSELLLLHFLFSLLPSRFTFHSTRFPFPVGLSDFVLQHFNTLQSSTWNCARPPFLFSPLPIRKWFWRLYARARTIIYFRVNRQKRTYTSPVARNRARKFRRKWTLVIGFSFWTRGCHGSPVSASKLSRRWR